MRQDGQPGGPQTPRVEPLTCCPACGASSFELLFTSEDLLHDVPGTYHYSRCRSCASVFQNPRVLSEDLWQCYPKEYFTHQPGAQAAIAPADGLRDRLRWAILHHADSRTDTVVDGLGLSALALLLSHVPSIRRRARFGMPDHVGLDQPGRRCLEIGPGKGDDMLRLHRLGWDVEGLEMDEEAAAVATSNGGGRVLCGRLEDLPWPDATFSLVYSSHVLEHLSDLRASMAAVFSLLRPGGKLVAVYPNAGGLVGRVYGKWSPTWDPPRHLILASAPAVRGLLAATGFSNIRVRSSSRSAAFYAAVARCRRKGLPGIESWGAKAGATDHLLRLVEASLSAFAKRGEELVVVAERR